jgi:BASS family bile acid:Na+ symporter
MLYADMMALIGDRILPGALICIMTGMGLSLTAHDFRLLFRNRRALAFGVCSMVVVPPLIGLAAALTLAPTPELAVGFVLLATTPGGMLSNLFTDMAKGNLALSMSMTLIGSMAYILLVPFYAHFAILHFMGVKAQVDVPLASFFWDIFSITVLPAVIGFAVQALRPGLAAKVRGPLKLSATVLLFTAFGFVLADQIPVLRAHLGSLLWITITINLLTLLAVMAGVRLMRFRRQECVAIGVEHLMRQEGTAIFIAITIFSNNEMALPMIMNTPVALLLVVLFTFTARRRAASRNSPAGTSRA